MRRTITFFAADLYRHGASTLHPFPQQKTQLTTKIYNKTTEDLFRHGERKLSSFSNQEKQIGRKISNSDDLLAHGEKKGPAF